jgi:hypothetical protein
LPVVKRGSRAQIVGATLRKSYLWPSIEVFDLRENMRVAAARRAGENADVLSDFAQLLLAIGEGRTTGEPLLPPHTPDDIRAAASHQTLFKVRFV